MEALGLAGFSEEVWMKFGYVFGTGSIGKGRVG
jgi:hypothetical protein